MKRNEIEGNLVGSLCIKYPWPGIARTIGVIISVIKKRILRLPGKYFTGDGALRDEVGITELQAVSMTLLSFRSQPGNRPIEDAINEHPAVAESAIVGSP
jgi:acetyl-CoA synthetase